MTWSRAIVSFMPTTITVVPRSRSCSSVPSKGLSPLMETDRWFVGMYTLLPGRAIAWTAGTLRPPR